MDRTPPAAGNEEIELYIRTIYSLLRSSGPIRLRSLEETHVGMNSSLHQRAASPEIDMAALTYAALRLPDCFPEVRLVVMGQMEEVFRRRGYPGVESWPRVAARARRRKLYFHPEHRVLAAFIASVSDIDDMVPTMVTYQIEWNKLHEKLNRHPSVLSLLEEESAPAQAALSGEGDGPDAAGTELLFLHGGASLREKLAAALDLTLDDFLRLEQVWPGKMLLENLRRAARMRLDVQINVLGSGLSDYRRSVQIWWQRLQENYPEPISERPVYFVSSNTHSLINLLTGFVWAEHEAIADFVRREQPEDLHAVYDQVRREQQQELGNFLYYASRFYLSHPQNGNARRRLQEREAALGIRRMRNPHCLDVEGQIIPLANLQVAWMDPRLGNFTPEEAALLGQSDALIFNIDYPLGMAAYHVFSQVSTAISDLMGVYILGKAATLNGRVGDVMIPNVVYDEHSRNTFLFRNCFTAQDVAPYLNHGTVFDNQKAVTVRGTFLQNREFMHVFYEESYTDIEMEAGPYLSAIYEDIYPKRYPLNEIVNIFINAPYDIGILHYASDTPISRRQTLLSKSLSYFGVDATYATTVPVARRILRQEIARQRQRQTGPSDGTRSTEGPIPVRPTP